MNCRQALLWSPGLEVGGEMWRAWGGGSHWGICPCALWSALARSTPGLRLVQNDLRALLWVPSKTQDQGETVQGALADLWGHVASDY